MSIFDKDPKGLGYAFFSKILSAEELQDVQICVKRKLIEAIKNVCHKTIAQRNDCLLGQSFFIADTLFSRMIDVARHSES